MTSFLEKYTRDGKVFKILDEFPLTKSENLFKEFANKYTGAYTKISGFNNWVENILPNQITKKSFVSPDGVKVIFKDVKLFSPRKVIDGKKEVLIYPQFCRERKYPYSGKLTVTCVTIKADGTRKVMEDIKLGYVPIMLGSIKCNLYGKSKEELVRLGECLTDPFGYFVISSERAVINIDKTRINVPIISVKQKISPKPMVSISYTSNRIIRARSGRKWNSIEVEDPVKDQVYIAEGIEKRFLPLFIFFKILLNIEPPEAIEEFIFPYFQEKFHNQVKNALSDSVIEYKSIVDPYSYLNSLRRKRQIQDLTKQEISDTLEKSLFVEVFDYIESQKQRKVLKLFSLGFVISKYISFVIGNTEQDNLNRWATKRFESPGVLMEILFEHIVETVIKKCRKPQGSTGAIDYSSFGLRLRDKGEGVLKSIFETSISTGDWGSKDSKFARKGHAENAIRDTPLQLWSLIDKTNNNGASPHSKEKETREIQPDQKNRHCIVETPESEQIGYVKHASNTCCFSLERDKLEIIETISNVCTPKSDQNTVVVTVNGMVFLTEGEVAFAGEKTIDQIKNLRRSGKLPHDIEIYRYPELNVVDIQCNSSRPVTPFLIVNRETNKLVIDEKNGWEKSIDYLLKNGCVEFLGPMEEDLEDIIISTSVENYYDTREKILNASGKQKEYYKKIYDYSHCNIDPNQVFSITSSLCPMANHQVVPRTIFQASMIKQALGFFNINYHLRFAKTFKRLYKATRPFTETLTYPIPQLDLFPCGQTANLALYADPDNQEDAVLVSKDFLDSKNLNFLTYKTIVYSQPTQIAGAFEKFQRPNVRKNEDPGIYKNIEDNGFPALDSYIRKGDCVIGKVLIKKDGKIINNSVYAQMDEEGYVEAVEVNREKDGQNIFVKIRLRRYRKYQAGDKLALRYAQKGTVGKVVSRKDLLRISSGPNRGIYPDVVFNPHSFPTRQTVGLLIEGILNKAALFTGERVNVSSFKQIDLEKYRAILKKNGMDENGLEEMETYSGKKIPRKIFFVPLYEQALKHHAMDKIQMRDTGNKHLYTHQPIGGRTTGSGIRVGEMEKDCFIAHGASSVLQERLMKSSDEFRIVVCQTCGTIINNRVCESCDKSDPGLLNIPYTFKLLIHLLNGIGIDIKMKTQKI